MAKHITKDLDIAAGFFSNVSENQEKSQQPEKQRNTEIPSPKLTTEKKTPRRGRPKKETLKNKNFSITMDPVLYEKIRIISKDITRGNISAFIDIAVVDYCNSHNINLNEITIAPEILENYKKNQSQI